MLLSQNQFFRIDISVIIALIALYYTFREIRRNNNVVIKIRKSSFGCKQSIDENSCRIFTYFEVTIQNMGANLYSPTMYLIFNHEKGGTINCSLKKETHIKESSDTFSKGMIATYYFKSYELNNSELELLCAIENTRKQNACLCIYSQNYIAKKYRINNYADKIKQKWNRFSSKLSYRMKKGKSWEGNDIVKIYQLPLFNTLGDQIEMFVESCRERHGEKISQG